MTLFRRVAACFLVVTLAFAPALAEARAGASYGNGGSSYYSMGSRGSRTYDQLGGAAPMQRSVTPSAPSSYGSAGAAWGSPGYGYGYGYNRGGFMRGLVGGLFGAWIASSLFGGPAYAYGGGGMHGGFLGTLIMFLLLFFLARLVWRSFARGAVFGGGGFYRTGDTMMGGGYQPVPRVAQGAITLAQGDFDTFGQILREVQAGWSHGDLDRLRRATTPEMLSYFSEMLSNNASQGVANRIENVTLVSGQPLESWQENGVAYASARLAWTALDYTHRTDRGPGAPGWLVEGSNERPVEQQEIWTFRRVVGGRWLLSAIQQVR